MLTKIQATVLLVIGTAYAAFQVWNYVPPVGEELVTVLINAIFALLAVVWPSFKLFQAVSRNITRQKIETL